MADDVLRMEVWEGDWDLPSVDCNCLAALAYCKFSQVPVKVLPTNNPWRSPSGMLPVMRHNDTVETKVMDIFSYLRKMRWGSDFKLSAKQCADVVAFVSMVEEKLLPALLHLWWLDSQTFVDVTRPWYARALPFPQNFYIPGRYKTQAEQRVYSVKLIDTISDKDIEAKIYKDAKECLNNLSYKLSENDYFFGDTPSALDAVVFGYLAPLMKAPLSTNQLTTHLKGCDNLMALCNKILQQYFKLTPEQMEAKRLKAKKEEDPLEFPNKRRDMILASIFAVSCMVVYSFASGLIQVEVIDTPETD